MVEVFSGPEWIARHDPETRGGSSAIERAEALLASADRTLDDLTVATALHVPSPGNVATITALQLRGVEAYELVEAAIGFMRGEIGSPKLELRSVSDKTILRVRDASVPGTYPVTVYSVGDTVWFVDAERPLLEEIVRALPDAPGATAADDLAAIFPSQLGGQRRTSLLVQSGWEGLQLFRSLHVDGNQLEVDAFLTTGASLDDMTRASGLWPDASVPSASASLLAFRIARADPEVMRRVLREVLLPRIGRGRLREEAGQVAGREVTLLWDDASRSGDAPRPIHLHVSGDTIWLVDAGQPLLAGIVAALPPAPPRETPARDLAATFPEEFGGVRRTHLSVKPGWAVPLATRTPVDLDQVATDTLALTGAGPDDLASASGLSLETGFGTTLAAYQVASVDPVTMRAVLEEVLLPRLGGSEARHELVEVAGREVFRLHTGPVSGGPSHLFVNGDTIWWLDAPESFLVDLFDELP